MMPITVPGYCACRQQAHASILVQGTCTGSHLSTANRTRLTNLKKPKNVATGSFVRVAPWISGQSQAVMRRESQLLPGGPPPTPLCIHALSAQLPCPFQISLSAHLKAVLLYPSLDQTLQHTRPHPIRPLPSQPASPIVSSLHSHPPPVIQSHKMLHRVLPSLASSPALLAAPSRLLAAGSPLNFTHLYSTQPSTDEIGPGPGSRSRSLDQAQAAHETSNTSGPDSSPARSPDAPADPADLAANRWAPAAVLL